MSHFLRGLRTYEQPELQAPDSDHPDITQTFTMRETMKHPNQSATGERAGAFVALGALALALCSPGSAAAADLYHSPNDDGVAGEPVRVPADGRRVTLNLYLDGGVAESAPEDKCNGVGTGDEICAWDLVLAASGGLRIEAFRTEADVVFHLADDALRANGLDPYAPLAAPKRVGQLDIVAETPGSLSVTGNAAIRSSFVSEPIGAGVLAVTDVDSDGDGLSDTIDNCVATANADQRDIDGDGIGSVCDADLSQDCVVDFVDLASMKAAFFSADANPDLSGDGSVDFVDLAILKAGFFENYATANPSGVANLCAGGTQP